MAVLCLALFALPCCGPRWRPAPGSPEAKRLERALTRFPESYEESRARFREGLDRFRQLWPAARLASHRIEGSEGLTIDWIEADALEEKKRLLIVSSGQHGAEAYVGSAVLQLFVEEYLHQLNPKETGVLVVHAINPWGMKHRRRTNAANVDLNRNFIMDPSGFDASLNPDYARLNSLLNPEGRVRSLSGSTCAMYWRLAGRMLSMGTGRIHRAVLLGQYRHPKGIYYGGTALQDETGVLMGLLEGHIQSYERVVHLDMHSGWGPRYQMSVVTSPQEPRDSDELEQAFGYPAVVKPTPGEFYSIRGDMIDYVYALVQGKLPGKRLFAAAFEFGTLGESTFASLRGLRAEILENQMHWHGASSQRVRQRVMHQYMELNAPPQERWRAKAIDDARQAFAGILAAEEFLPPLRPGRRSTAR